jgi:hypothetical protein
MADAAHWLTSYINVLHRTLNPGTTPLHPNARSTPRSDWRRSLTRRSDSATLRAEIARLRTDNDDLRASAECWFRLYDGAAERALQLEAELRAAGRHES